MGIHPKTYDKETFLDFLDKNNVNEITYNKFKELPEFVERSEIKFKLDINVIWYSHGNTHYTFEINYYSEELIEYLFSSKIFYDVDTSINFIVCELTSNRHIKIIK